MVYLRKFGKLVFPSLLVMLFILGSSLPVLGNENGGTCTIEVREQTTTVTVCSNFEIDIWITDITGDQMYLFDFTVTWDNTQMELVGYQNHVISNTGGFWTVDVETAAPTSYRLRAHYLYNLDGGYTADASWVTLTFHCIAVGSSPINIESVDIEGPANAAAAFFELVTVVNGVCNQNPRYTPSYSSWVGGELYSVNKLAVLVPFLALIAVAAVATVYIAKRRPRA